VQRRQGSQCHGEPVHVPMMMLYLLLLLCFERRHCRQHSTVTLVPSCGLRGWSSTIWFRIHCCLVWRSRLCLVLPRVICE
jgi:hypothetical protein